MKRETLISIFKFAFILLVIWFMYFASPTKAEVERYFEENKCFSKDMCVYYEMRRNTGMLWGQIFKIPNWWVLPNFILYTTTPFNYYHDINHDEDDWHTYTWVDTREGRFVYNAVNGEYIKEIDDKEDPTKKYYQDMDDYVQKMKDFQKSAECGYNKYNCSDFSSYSLAKFVYDKCGGISNDVHYLDGDMDGIPCEVLR